MGRQTLRKKQAALPFVMAIDPGLQGAIVITDGVKLTAYPLPIGGDKRLDYWKLSTLLDDVVSKWGALPTYLERAIPFAMGARHAFGYGVDFQSIVLAIEHHKLPVTYVEPAKWTKEMHQGVASDFKPKVKSAVAAKRLFPQLVGLLPTKPKGGMHDGMIDALLIAGWALRVKHGQSAPQVSVYDDRDFF